MALTSCRRALGKLGHSCCLLAARGPCLPRGAQPETLKQSFNPVSIFLATKVALLSFKQKAPSFAKVGTCWNCLLTIKQEKTFKRPFRDIRPLVSSFDTCGEGGVGRGVGKWREDLSPHCAFWRSFSSQRVFHHWACTVLIYFKCRLKKFRLGSSLETKSSC